jgi:hypothetical protein
MQNRTEHEGALDIDVLNVLNRVTEEGLATDNVYSPSFGQPTVFVDPRRVMLGARLNIGREWFGLESGRVDDTHAPLRVTGLCRRADHE